jgi:rod shape determining protein RodA
LRELGVILAASAIPFALIYKQPDLGTALVLGAILVGVLLVAGAKPRHMALLGVILVVGVTAVLHFGVLHQYQKERLTAFLDPATNTQASAYNLDQSKIAIGSGRVEGKGLFRGTQTNLSYVPEQHTDFIFTVAGEELGLVGSAVLIALLGVVLWRALRIAMRADDLFGRVAAAGIACWFGFQAFQNIGMCLGIMPVTGVPLPLVSYGGSSMFASLMAIGLLQNIHLRSDEGIGVTRSRLHRSRF